MYVRAKAPVAIGMILAIACERTATVGHDLPNTEGSSGSGGTESTAAATTEGATTTKATAEPGSTSTTASTEASIGSGGGDSGSTGTAGTAGSDGDGLACTPIVGDNACVTCTKLQCCDQTAACLEEPGCSCFFDCLAGGATPPQCANRCQPTMKIADLFMCIGTRCGMICA